jgi:hypothetical protein
MAPGMVFSQFLQLHCVLGIIGFILHRRKLKTEELTSHTSKILKMNKQQMQTSHKP